MSTIQDLIKRANEQRPTAVDRNIVLLNIPAAHRQYTPFLLKLVKKYGKANTSIVIVAGDKTKEQLITQAKLTQATQIWVANYNTAIGLVSQRLGRGKKVDFDVWAGSVLWLDNGLMPCMLLHPLVDIYKRRWVGKALSYYIKKAAAIPTLEPTFSWFPLGHEGDNMILDTLFNQGIQLIAIDIETNRDVTITCIGFSILKSDNTIINYVIDLRSNVTVAKLELTRRLCGCDAPKVFHNGTYDNQILQQNAIVVNNWTLDTEYLMYAQYEELPRSLAFVAGLYLPEACYWKHIHDDDLLEYNARDCEQTLRACVTMLESYPDYAKPKYAKIFALTTPALYCALHGMLVNPAELGDLKDKALAEIEPLEKQLRSMVGLGLNYKTPEGMQEVENININSPKQLAWLLFDVLGGALPQGKRSTDAKAMAKLELQHPLLAQFIYIIRTVRKQRKAVSTYFNADLRHDRLYYSYRIDGTETGRLSCKQSNFGSIGAQIQNVPYYMKGALLADKGYKLCEIDKSQAEARITAYFANDTTLRDALEDDTKDFYLTCGELFFSIPYEEVTLELRNKVIKRIIHGTNYMMQAPTFIDTVGIVELRKAQALLNMEDMSALDFANFLLSRYHEAYPEVRKWHQATQLELATKGYLESPLGWRRYFFGDPSQPATLRSAVAHQPQNINVDVVNTAFVQVFWQCVVPSQGKFCLIAQVHDSIVFQSTEDTITTYKDKAVRIMEDIPVTFPSGDTLVIPVDGEIGSTWAEVK